MGRCLDELLVEGGEREIERLGEPEVARVVGRDAGVSQYDAGYLWLARSLNLPLATFDEHLIQAAPKAGVKLFDISTL